MCAISDSIDFYYKQIRGTFHLDPWQQVGSPYATEVDRAKREQLPATLCQWCRTRDASPGRRSCSPCAVKRVSTSCGCGRAIRKAGTTRCGRCRQGGRRRANRRKDAQRRDA